MHYSRIIRALHALTALTITFQMVISLVMDHPRTSRPMSATGGLFFRWHEWVGLAALAILVCGWAYRLISWKRESQGRLFPWLGSPGRQALFQDLKQFLLLRWTSIPEDGALAGTVHGLGLLIAAAMVVTGGVIYFLLGSAGYGDAHGAQRDGSAFVSGHVHVDLPVLACVHGGVASVHGAWQPGADVQVEPGKSKALTQRTRRKKRNKIKSGDTKDTKDTKERSKIYNKNNGLRRLP